jgi:hypothetical protein
MPRLGQRRVRFHYVAGRLQSGEKTALRGSDRGVGAGTVGMPCGSSGKGAGQEICTKWAGLTFAVVVLFFLPALPAFAARLGGAYYVDDAEIGKVGSCEIESWSSFAASGDRIAVFSPACVVKLGAPVELGTNLVNLRSDAQDDYLATLTAKTVPIPIGRTGFGLAIAGAVVYDPRNQTGNGFIINVPVTYDFSKELRLNINFGTQYYTGGDPHGIYATAGAGVSWTFVRHWSVISEVFALLGPGQTNPRFQTGLR